MEQVSEVFYRKIMADLWSEKMSIEMVPLSQVYLECIERLEKEKEEDEKEKKRKEEEARGKAKLTGKAKGSGKRNEANLAKSTRRRRGKEEKVDEVSLDKVFRISVKKHSTSMVRLRSVSSCTNSTMTDTTLTLSTAPNILVCPSHAMDPSQRWC